MAVDSSVNDGRFGPTTLVAVPAASLVAARDGGTSAAGTAAPTTDSGPDGDDDMHGEFRGNDMDDESDREDGSLGGVGAVALGPALAAAPGAARSG